jgi:hypothetical protein
VPDSVLKLTLVFCCNLGEGRLDFHHRAVSKAVRLKYLTQRTEETEQHRIKTEKGEGLGARVEYASMSVKELKALMISLRIPLAGCVEKSDMVHRLREAEREAGREMAGEGEGDMIGVQQAGQAEEGVTSAAGTACRAKERYTYYHGRLADYFEGCSGDLVRRAEELPYHLEKVLDNSR